MKNRTGSTERAIGLPIHARKKQTSRVHGVALCANAKWNGLSRKVVAMLDIERSDWNR